MMQVLPPCGHAVQEDKPDKVRKLFMSQSVVECTRSTSPEYFHFMCPPFHLSSSSLLFGFFVFAGGWSCGRIPAETQICRSQKRNQEVKHSPLPFFSFTKHIRKYWNNVLHSLSSSNSFTQWGLQVRCYFNTHTCFTSVKVLDTSTPLQVKGRHYMSFIWKYKSSGKLKNTQSRESLTYINVPI